MESRLKDPNKVINVLGDLTIELGLSVAKGLPETTVAMVQVARAEQREDTMRSQKKDDYSIPLEKLMDAFDTFIQEWSKRKVKTGDLRNYDLGKPRDLTILLLWQIRNIRTHSGGLISDDQQAKKRYEEYFKIGTKRGIKPIIDLPQELKPGNELIFSFEDFKLVKEAIFDYIGERIPKPDLDILRARSEITDLTTTGISVQIKIEGLGLMEIDLVTAYKLGCRIDANSGNITFPSPAAYFPKTGKICFASTGECMTVRIVRPRNKNSMKLKS